MVSGDLEIMEGPIQILDNFPWAIPLFPTYIKNKWMKVDLLEKSRDEFCDFLKVKLIYF